MIYAVADIHGHLAQLDRALRLIEADGGPDAPIVFLGDYVDRGPDSAGVLSRLIEGLEAGRPWICLRGNHDRLFQIFVEIGALCDGVLKPGRHWLDEKSGGQTTLASVMGADVASFLHTRGGGIDTLGSYGVAPDPSSPIAQLHAETLRHMPQAHRDFLAGLRDWHSDGARIFVHAGLRPGVPIEAQTQDDLVWIREPFLSDPRDHGALIVHGHTILKRPQHYGNRVNLDGGAGAGRLLIPAVFDDTGCHILTDVGRWPLRPPLV